MASDELDRANARYESAEVVALDAFRSGVIGAVLVESMMSVAGAADGWNAAAYADYHASTGERRNELDLITEVTEVVSELWRDIATAVAEGHQN